MKEKIRARMPDFVFEILEKDQKHFELTKEKLCNKVLFNFSFSNTVIEDKNLLFEEYNYLQFTLDKVNQEYYRNLLENLQIKNESKFIREIFLHYAISHAFVRESYLFREKISFFQSLMEEKDITRFHTPDGIIENKITKIYRDKEIGYIFVKMDNNKVYYLSQIQAIS